jgi:protein-tyrosine phosphatase
MIDTHCHLLHSLDDGPTSESGSLELARQLVGAGVTAVVCTPHFSRRYPTPHSSARERMVELEPVLAAAAIPLSLSLAAEVSPAFAVSAPPEELVPRSIEGHFLLVELEPDTPAAFLETAVDRLAGEGLIPAFAHPERCRAVRDRPRLLDEARAAGALVQVVAPSLTGRWGKDIGIASWRLLDSGIVDLLGSDSHRPARSASHLERAMRLIVERYGRAVLVDLTERAPARLVGGARREA